MIKKILIFNYTNWNQIPAALIEGLKLNKDLELLSTTETNYAADISINTKLRYFPFATVGDGIHKFSDNGNIISGPPPDMNIHSSVVNEDSYNDECKNLMDECDLIIIFDYGHEMSSAHYYIMDEKNEGVPVITPSERQNTVVCSLHEYAVDNYKDKIVMIDPTDWGPRGEGNPDFIPIANDAGQGVPLATIAKYHELLATQPIQYGMYGRYKGGRPNDCKIYFKREKSLDLDWRDNVEPMPFASEERYFTGGKNFNKIWDDKDIDISCLFRVKAYTEGADLRRGHIRRVVKEHCNVMGNIKNIIGSVYDDLSVAPAEKIERQISGIDTSSYKFKNDKVLGRARRHHSTYYNTLLKTKINIDGLPGQHAFYTGRMMESLANGCCYFYPKPNYRPDFPNGLIDGEDFIIYNTPEDLVERLHYYLNHPNEMRTIAENGFNKLIKYHTSEVRAKEFIDICERYME